MNNQSPVVELSKRLKTAWPAIQRAAERSFVMREALTAALGSYTSEDVSLVVFGSLGRREVTSASDLDWILLIDGIANPEHMTVSLEIENHLRSQELRGPGVEATFGGLVFSHSLIHYIGGEDDTNANLTRRMLLLLESTSIGRDDARHRAIANVLSRYILEDFGWMHGSNPMHVPRFLQNDIARYWRTLAVDFAYKRRQRAGRGWALRTAKLRLSRKLIYAGGLLMCYSCATDPSLASIIESKPRESAAFAVVAYLAGQVERTPLDRFAEFFLKEESLGATAAHFFGAYDAFLALLNDDEKRARLESLQHDEIASDPVYEEVRTIGHAFQNALNEIFFAPAAVPKLYELTKTYGVF